MLLVDTHVHIHPCFEPAAVFAGAALRFAAAARHLGGKDDFEGVLCLTEIAGTDRFHAIASATTVGTAEGPHGRWRVSPTAEPDSLIVERDGLRLVIVAGRQIATRERLEVLALATAETFPDGQGLTASVDAVLASGAVAVLPWGFGKWRGRRRAAVERLLDRHPGPGLFLADNGNRPRLAPDPRPFRAPRAVGVLSGSDPLPIAGEESQVGRAGIVLEDSLDAIRPAADLRERLRRLDRAVQRYGRGETLARFARNQIAMQSALRRPTAPQGEQWA